MVEIHKRRIEEGKQLSVKGARQKEKFYSRSCVTMCVLHWYLMVTRR